jgi:phosphatidylglycerophosphate synthase
MPSSHPELPMSAPELPAFETLLKSREVEDPVNLWLHRPLAYAFVALVYRSPITPNQVTLLALLVGLAAGACFLVGTPQAMLCGGLLLWTSAILDGADGILARAKRSFSDLGRALDGTADMIVAIATVLPAFYHLWAKHEVPGLLWVAPIAVGTAVVHIYMYDFYKESYLHMTNPSWHGRAERIADAEARLQRVKAERRSLAEIFASRMYVDLTRAQTRQVALTNPWASREGLQFRITPATVELYRRYNRGPIKLWAMISLAPHSYLMAIAAMLDHLELYLWLRLVGGNLLFAIALLWQRAASRRTRAQLQLLGMEPIAAS